MQKVNTISKSKSILFLALVILYFFLLLLATSPRQTSAASGFTCDAAKDYGNTCIDTTGKPRCKAPYSEQCGPSCSRQITCGRSGEFKAGECICANQNQTTDSPATGNIVQNETLTCPVATIWDGTICKGTAVGTDYETKDQPPKENGGDIVADNGQHGGEISRQQGNNLGAGSGGGGLSGGVNTETSGNTINEIASAINACLAEPATGFGLATVVRRCTVGDFVYIGTIQQLRQAAISGDTSGLNAALSKSALDRCVARDDGANDIVRCTIDGVLIETSVATFQAAAQGDTGAIDLFRIALQADQNGNGEGAAEANPTCTEWGITKDGNSFCHTVSRGIRRLYVIQLGEQSNFTFFVQSQNTLFSVPCEEDQKDSVRKIAGIDAVCVENSDGAYFWLKQTSELGDISIEANEVIEDSKCNRLNQFSDDGELYCYEGHWLRVIQAIYEGGNTLALSNGKYIWCEIMNQTQVHKNINYTCLSSGLENDTKLWRIQINIGDVCDEEGMFSQSKICKAGWADANNYFIENRYINVANNDTTRIYCDNDEQYNTGRKGYFDNVEYECKRIWVENTQSSSFQLFTKASAQTLPPIPELVDIDNLTPGKYLISIPGFETAEFTVGNEQVQITFFNDTNGNGVQDTNEPIINPKDFATSISKIESIYTINLKIGWNLINLPVANSVIKKASDLSDYIRLTGGDVYQISTYQSGNWVHYVSRINDENKITEFGSDFNIVPGQSYFINSARRSQFRISGNDFLEQPPINIQNGWNLVGFPAQTKQTASEILRYCQNFGSTCQTIARFVDGIYETVVDDFGIIFGNDFPIQKTEGYFVLNQGKEAVVRW